MDEFIIRTRNLQKSYSSKLAINDFSVDISSNSITGLIGRNGSGKTTLMKILAGLLDKTNGDVKVFNENPMDNINVLSNLVYTYHNLEYENNITLETITDIYKCMFPLFDNEFAMKLINYFELNKKIKYKQLSQGMGSIFNFICGLSCRTKLTMFDEPVLGMDVTVRKAAYEILLRDYTEYPRTFIVSSHLLSELEGMLSDIILIDNGKLVFHNSLDNIRQSAYRADAAKDMLDLFCQNKKVIFRKSSDIVSYAVIYEPLTNDVLNYAKIKGIKISPVRPEELYVYLTKSDKEDELECLWTKQN